MNLPKTFLIILTTALLSFTGGYSVYFLPQVLGSNAASTTNPASSLEPATSKQIRASMRLLPLVITDRTRVQELTTINQGTTLDLELVINANGQAINGADSIISYDPNLLEILAIKPAYQSPTLVKEPTEAQKPESDSGKLASNFLFLRKEAREGKIYLTVVKEQTDENLTNELTLATITLKGLKPGTAVLNFDHFPGKTYGSTIIRAEDSENILDEVRGVTIEIQ